MPDTIQSAHYSATTQSQRANTMSSITAASQPHHRYATAVPARNLAPARTKSSGQALTIVRTVDRATAIPLTVDEAATVDTIYRKYSGMMLTVATRMLQAESDAQDVVHQVFYRLAGVLAQHTIHSMGGWLKRATVTECLMHLRRTRGRRECGIDVPDDIEFAAPAPSVEEGEIHWALSQLSPLLREVIVLRYFMACSHRDIAATLDITEAVSEIRTCRGVKQLRLLLRATAVNTSAKKSDERKCHA